jgi:branched-chain amino acid transport system permease protein
VAEIILTYTLINGGVFALLAIGFSLIFGVARVINMAHTAFLMLALYIQWFLMYQQGWGILEAIAVAVVVTTLLGFLVYRFIIDRVREHHGAVLLITIAIAMMIEQILSWHMMNTVGTTETRMIRPLIFGYVEIFGVRVLNQHLLTLGIAAVMIIIVWLLLTKTKMGIAIRATAQDAEVANLMGISTSRILLICMVIATALAAVAGILEGPLEGIRPTMWGSPLVMTMVIVVLGGLGSIKGSIIGAFIIAFVGQLSAFLLPQGGYLIETFVLLAMVIVLVVRPGGLFGIMLEEERL